METTRTSAPSAARSAATPTRAAQPAVLVLVMQDRHRRIRAEPLGVAVQVTVQHQVADQHDPAGRQAFDNLNETVWHGVTQLSTKDTKSTKKRVLETASGGSISAEGANSTCMSEYCSRVNQHSHRFSVSWNPSSCPSCPSWTYTHFFVGLFTEQRKARRVPVDEILPPTGPSSPAAKNPATGVAGIASAAAPMSWQGFSNSRLPRPLQLNSSPPAGGARGLLRVQHHGQVLAGGLGVAGVELHGLPGPHVVGNADRAALLVDPDHVADQEIAAAPGARGIR